MKPADFIFFGRPILVIPVWTIYVHFLTVAPIDTNTLYSPLRLLSLAGLTMVFMAVYVLNQIYDVESDRINNKLHFLPKDMISIRAAWIWYAALTVSGLTLILLTFPESLPACLLIVVMGVGYSIPGLRLKDRPVAGLLSNAAAYGLLVPMAAAPTIVYATLGGPAIPYFLAVATGYILTTIPDFEGDRATGKRTVAVTLGPKRALWLALIVAILTAWTAVFTRNYEVATVAVATAILVLYLLISFQPGVMLLACKAPILLLTLMAAFHFPLYLAVLVLTIVLTRVYYKNRFGIIYPRLR